MSHMLYFMMVYQASKRQRIGTARKANANIETFRTCAGAGASINLCHSDFQKITSGMDLFIGQCHTMNANLFETVFFEKC